MSKLKSIRVAARCVALIVGLWFFYLGASNLVRIRLAAAEKSLPSTSLYEVMPEADRFSPSQEEPCCYYAFRGGKLTGLCFVTTEVEPGIVGYGGPVPVFVGLSLDGRITRIKILENRETPGFIKRVYEKSFLSQYEGKSIKDAFRAGADLDGITGATITVGAINESLKKASEKIARHYLGISAKGKVWRRATISIHSFFTAGLFLFAAIALFVTVHGPLSSPLCKGGLGGISGHMCHNGISNPPQSPFTKGGRSLLSPPRERLPLFLKPNVLRYLCMGIAIVYLGFFRKTLFVTADIIKFLAHQMSPERYLFVGLVLLVTILFGRFYCGWLCPFGAVIELLNKIVRFAFRGFKVVGCHRKRLNLNLKLPPRFARRLRWLRLIILGALLAIFFITGKFALIEIEPFKELFHLKATTIRWIFLSGVLIISAFSSRFWCKYLCPAGAFLALLSRLRHKRKNNSTNEL